MSQLEHRILEHMQTAVVVCDAELRLTLLNSSAEALLNTSAERARGSFFSSLFLDDDGLETTIKSAVDTDQPLTRREAVVRISPNEEEITVDCTATPCRSSNADSREVVVELTALDRLKRLAREGAWLDVHTANQKVMRGLAHEVKNPLGGLRGAAQLLARQLDGNELQEYTDIIISEADRLRSLVDRMAGPMTQYEPALVNIHRVTERVRALMHAELKDRAADGDSNVRIVCDYDPSLPDIAGEDELLIQAVLNLVKNAVDAVGKDGTITLRTRIDRQITIDRVRHRQVLRLDVIDDGPGIPAELQDTIFYPMVTGRADGTGLGLSITQDIVSRHSGLMEFASQPGETRFSIYLPFDAVH